MLFPLYMGSCLDSLIGVTGPAPAASLVDASALERTRRDEGVALSRLAVTPKSLSTTRPSWLMRTFAACTAAHHCHILTISITAYYGWTTQSLHSLQ